MRLIAVTRPLKYLGIVLLAAIVCGSAWLGLKASTFTSSAAGDTAASSADSESQLDELVERTIDSSSPPAQATESASSGDPGYGTLVYATRRNGQDVIVAQPAGSSDMYLLTDAESDARFPSVSPDGSQIAYASNQKDGWDLYSLDLTSGRQTQLTDTPYYEGASSWSPDGRWIVYEVYLEDQFDLWILALDGSQAPLQLTTHPGIDFSPDWDPAGRQITFVSNRDGSYDLFVANLDQPDQRFRNLTNSPDLAETHPQYDSSGSKLAYSASINGLDQILIYSVPDGGVQILGHGAEPVWALGSEVVIGMLNTPFFSQAVMYPVEGVHPQIASSLVGNFAGLAWTPLVPGEGVFNPLLHKSEMQAQAADNEIISTERLNLVEIPGVAPAGSMLSPRALEPFLNLRERSRELSGWDFLAQLEAAWVGLNDPLPPGYAFNDWLYTGRAFAFNPAPLQAGWVEVVKEDYGAETYWRIYLRTLAQDGSQGTPLTLQPWDFSTRYNGNSLLYNEGGSLKPEPPAGYYLDFTTLARDFGFDRLPALSNWKTYYKGARFNEFALLSGQDWESAMLEIYPKQAIVTPTAFQTPTLTLTPTPTPTRTPWWLRWRTATPSITPTELASSTSTP